VTCPSCQVMLVALFVLILALLPGAVER